MGEIRWAFDVVIVLMAVIAASAIFVDIFLDD